jgi:SAM-dependent methyltransferase
LKNKKQKAEQKSRQNTPAARVHKELLPEQSPELLKQLHILTRDGQLNADSRRKLKQINHLANLLTPDLERLFADDGDPLIVDAGAGNGYLGFVLYELWCQPLARGTLLSLEVRPELVARAKERAETLGFERMVYEQKAVAELVPQPDPVRQREGARPAIWRDRKLDAVVALHACDTATDDAIALGIRGGASVIALVPCCQAEVARLLAGTAVHSPAGALWRHPLHRREFGANLTNVIRAHVLEAFGYQVTVTELTGWEHSLKNELILARKVQGRNRLALKQLQQLLAGLPYLPMGLLQQLLPPEDAASDLEAPESLPDAAQNLTAA